MAFARENNISMLFYLMSYLVILSLILSFSLNSFGVTSNLNYAHVSDPSNTGLAAAIANIVNIFIEIMSPLSIVIDPEVLPIYFSIPFITLPKWGMFTILLITARGFLPF